MKYHGSAGWGSLAFAALALPLLMGAKGGCGGDVSMGSDVAGAAGSGGSETGGKANSPGSGGAIPRGGAEATGGAIPRGGAEATGGAIARGGAGAQGGMAQGGGIARGGANSCDGFENSSSSDEVTVRYVNDGTEPIYVGRTRTDVCSDDHEFRLVNAEGGDLSWGAETCLTCAALQLGSQMCPTICLMPRLVRIDPGGSYDFSWAGTYYQAADMPLECYRGMGLNGKSCSKVVTAEAAAYRVIGTAWSSLTCPAGDRCDDCFPNDAGGCAHWYGAATGTSRQVTVELDYPAEKLVELHFD